MSKLRLWLDDCRPMPHDFNCHVHSAPEAIEKIAFANGDIEYVSLDHDLGQFEGTGYDVATFIEEAANDNVLDPFDCFIHTANPVARERMKMALLSAAGFWETHTGKVVKIEVRPAVLSPKSGLSFNYTLGLEPLPIYRSDFKLEIRPSTDFESPS